MRAFAVLALVTSCHRDPPPDCASLIRVPMRELGPHAFWQACAPLMPAACRPATGDHLDAAALARLEADCRAVVGGSGDVFAAALPRTMSEDDRNTVALALRSEIGPRAVTLHVGSGGVEIDGKRMSPADAAAVVHAQGGGAIVWGGFDEPATRDALLAAMRALGDTQYVMCTRDGANCR